MPKKIASTIQVEPELNYFLSHNCLGSCLLLCGQLSFSFRKTFVSSGKVRIHLPNLPQKQ